MTIFVKTAPFGLIEEEVHFLQVRLAYSVPRLDLLSHTSVEPLTTNVQCQKIISSNDNVTIATLASYPVQANHIREILASFLFALWDTKYKFKTNCNHDTEVLI